HHRHARGRPGGSGLQRAHLAWSGHRGPRDQPRPGEGLEEGAESDPVHVSGFSASATRGDIEIRRWAVVAVLLSQFVHRASRRGFDSRQNHGTGSLLPNGTSRVQRESRRSVSSRPREIPNRRTAAIEYSEQDGIYRHRTRPISNGRPSSWYSRTVST